jgi:hypothetical protein
MFLRVSLAVVFVVALGFVPYVTHGDDIKSSPTPKPTATCQDRTSIQDAYDSGIKNAPNPKLLKEKVTELSVPCENGHLYTITFEPNTKSCSAQTTNIVVTKNTLDPRAQLEGQIKFIVLEINWRGGVPTIMKDGDSKEIIDSCPEGKTIGQALQKNKDTVAKIGMAAGGASLKNLDAFDRVKRLHRPGNLDTAHRTELTKHLKELGFRDGTSTKDNPTTEDIRNGVEAKLILEGLAISGVKNPEAAFSQRALEDYETMQRFTEDLQKLPVPADKGVNAPPIPIRKSASVAPARSSEKTGFENESNEEYRKRLALQNLVPHYENAREKYETCKAEAGWRSLWSCSTESDDVESARTALKENGCSVGFFSYDVTCTDYVAKTPTDRTDPSRTTPPSDDPAKKEAARKKAEAERLLAEKRRADEVRRRQDEIYRRYGGDTGRRGPSPDWFSQLFGGGANSPGSGYCVVSTQPLIYHPAGSPSCSNNQALQNACLVQKDQNACRLLQQQCQQQGQNQGGLGKAVNVIGSILGGGQQQQQQCSAATQNAINNSMCSQYRGTQYTNGKCECPSGGEWDGTQCKAKNNCSQYPGTTLQNGRCECPTGKQWSGSSCVDGTGKETLRGELSCAPKVADVNETPIAISWLCYGASTSKGDGFSTGGTPSGSATTMLRSADLSKSSTRVDLTLTCINEGKTSVSLCPIEINRPFIIATAVLSTVPRGQTTTIGWIVSGMAESGDVCTMTSNRHAGFEKKGRNVVVTTPPIQEATEFTIKCKTRAGGTREAKVPIIVQ